MRRILFTLVLLVTTTFISADNDLRFNDGDKTFFSHTTGNATLEIHYENATINDSQPFAQKYSNIERVVKLSFLGFITEKEGKINNLSIVKDNVTSTDYLIAINVTNVTEKLNRFSFSDRLYQICISGTVKVSDKKNGQCLFLADIDDIDGKSALTFDIAFMNTFNEIAKCLSRFK